MKLWKPRIPWYGVAILVAGILMTLGITQVPLKHFYDVPFIANSDGTVTCCTYPDWFQIFDWSLVTASAIGLIGVPLLFFVHLSTSTNG